MTAFLSLWAVEIGVAAAVLLLAAGMLGYMIARRM